MGMGSRQNLVKQHHPGKSKACKRNLKKKKKTSAHQQSQSELPSFFMKQPKVIIPPTIPMLGPVIAYAIESVSHLPATHTTELTPRQVPLAPNTHSVNILVALEKAVESLPVLPDASESDEITVFSENVPTDLAKEDTWEYLDPMLNHFLGFNRTLGSIYNELRGGERGLSAMVQYLKDFVHLYEIQSLKKLSQCFAILERVTWNKSNKLLNIMKIMYVILHHLGFRKYSGSCDLDQK